MLPLTNASSSRVSRLRSAFALGHSRTGPVLSTGASAVVPATSAGVPATSRVSAGVSAFSSAGVSAFSSAGVSALSSANVSAFSAGVSAFSAGVTPSQLHLLKHSAGSSRMSSSWRANSLTPTEHPCLRLPVSSARSSARPHQPAGGAARRCGIGAGPPSGRSLVRCSRSALRAFSRLSLSLARWPTMRSMYLAESTAGAAASGTSTPASTTSASAAAAAALTAASSASLLSFFPS
eukprot:9473293-Pyramimonas_sp.AAC.1